MHALISYDDTLNDQDALMLARVLKRAGAELSLAYVRHAVLQSPDDEELDHREAQSLLDRGARWLDDLDVARRVVVSGSTGEGLAQLAHATGAEMIVFGSDYRTPAGHVSPGRSAQRLLEGGRTALALAPAGYRTRGEARVEAIGVLPSGDRAVLETASSLAERFEGIVVAATRGVDLLVVGSREEAAEGRTLLSSRAMAAVEAASCPVIVLARGVPLVPALSLV